MNAPVVWYTRCPLPTALSLATHTGLLERRLSRKGVELRSLKQSSSKEVRLSHFNNTLPGMIRQGGHVPPLWSRALGRDVRLIGLSWTNEAQLLLTRPDSGIHSLADLRGRRLAIPVRVNYPIDHWRSTVLRGFYTALALAGLGPSDVEFVELHVPDEASSRREERSVDGSIKPTIARATLSAQRIEAHALIRNEVDVVFAPGHYGIALSAFLGAHVVADLSSQASRLEKLNNSTLLALTVEGSFLDTHRTVVVEAIAATLEGAKWAKTHAVEAARIIAAESGNAEELVPQIFGAGFAQTLEPSFSDDLLEGLERQATFLAEHRFTARKVPAEEWMDRELLTEARLRFAHDQPVTNS